MSTVASKYDERELPDEYPVYAGYLYVADGEPFRSEISANVRKLRHRLNAKVITSCDMVGREGQRAPWRGGES